MIGQKLKTGGHVFQQTGTTFELDQDIIKTNILTNVELGRDFIGAKLLTNFHEDGTRNVASRVFTSKWTDVRRTKTGQKSSPEQSGAKAAADAQHFIEIGQKHKVYRPTDQLTDLQTDQQTKLNQYFPTSSNYEAGQKYQS
ncbi:hypothetical protein DPMN_117810 [Dreissena polymorpha]|uniref:Uncharacterized protein n=1 Tax=Dreissena polymorpha TaxID=45954 RepID=A0A9D4GG92_DREPO|nr:hypothetical protein DPMN_117810 [Dreissena polymorpha]